MALSLALLAGLATPACSRSAEANQAVDSRADQGIAIPALTGRVVDNADLLSSEQELDLTRQLAELERQTTDQFVIVTVPSLNGRSIEDYGLELGNRWGVGQRGKNNGVLMIVAPGERKVRLEIGLGLEDRLTNELCQSIIDQRILPQFRIGNLPKGIAAGADAVIARLRAAS